MAVKELLEDECEDSQRRPDGTLGAQESDPGGILEKCPDKPWVCRGWNWSGKRDLNIYGE